MPDALLHRSTLQLGSGAEGPHYTHIDELPPVLDSQIGPQQRPGSGRARTLCLCPVLALVAVAAAGPLILPREAVAAAWTFTTQLSSRIPLAHLHLHKALQPEPPGDLGFQSHAVPSADTMVVGEAPAGARQWKPQTPPGPLQVFRTARATGERLARLEDVPWSPRERNAGAGDAWFEVDVRERKQEIVGFGGSFTDASAAIWHRLGKAEKNTVMNLLFAPPEKGGNGYTLTRTHINSCDFSTERYSYVQDGDVGLGTFNISRDRRVMIPFIRAAMDALEGAPLRIVASPWSPPAWMKLPRPGGGRTMEGSAVPVGLDSRYERAWAEYMSRYVSAYKAEGVPLWALTPQNEPENPAEWESCAWDKKTMGRWIREHVGPVMRRDHPELKLLGYDHNKDHLAEWAEELFAPGTASFVDGLAFHWYSDCDGQSCIERAAALGGAGKLLINTEACVCPMLPPGEEFDAERYARAEALAFAVMRDLDAGAHGWIDWNLLLNPEGGPSHTGANCESALVGDPNASTVVPLAWYYYFGHFSRFVRPGARVVKGTAGPGFAEPEAGGSVTGVGNGVAVVMEGCDGGSRQRWSFYKQDGCSHFYLTLLKKDGGHISSSQCFDLKGGGEEVQTWQCDCQNTNQGWSIHDSSTAHGDVMIQSKASGKCLTVPVAGTAKRPRLEARKCADIPQQHFHYDKASGRLRSSWSEQAGAEGLCVTAASWDLFRALAFEVDGKHAAVVVLNNGELPVSFTLRDAPTGLEAGPLKAPPHSATTYTYALAAGGPPLSV